MKLFSTILLAALLATPLHALDTAALAAVAKKFTADSGDEQYAARAELNRLVDNATAPGKDAAAATKALVAAVESADTPAEAKKYILRALARVGTGDAVPALFKLFQGSDAMLAEEARLAIEAIRGTSAYMVLEEALRKATDKRAKLGLINSVSQQKADTSAAALAPCTLDSDPEIARAALLGLARMGNESAATTLARAHASGKVSGELQADLEKAILTTGHADTELAQKILMSTKSDAVRMAAFTSVTKEKSAAASKTIGLALKSNDTLLRQAALKRGLELEVPALQKTLSMGIEILPAADRLVVLSSIDLVKPVELAEKVALGCAKSEDETEKVAAIAALGNLGSKGAFEAVLQALGAKEPAVNQAAGTALAQMDYDGGEAALLGMLNGDSSDDKVLAVKAANFRQVAGVNAILLKIILGSDEAAAKEAHRTIYSTATLDDLRAMCDAAKSAGDPQKKALASTCAKIAKRIGGDEAQKLVEGLK